MKFFTLIAPVFCSICLLTACGSGIDESRSIAEVQKEAAQMSSGQLESKISACQKLIEKRQASAKKLEDQLAAVPLNQLLSDGTKAKRDELAKLNSSIAGLDAQLLVYKGELSIKSKKN